MKHVVTAQISETSRLIRVPCRSESIAKNVAGAFLGIGCEAVQIDGEELAR
jgi:hypothetical protein